MKDCLPCCAHVASSIGIAWWISSIWPWRRWRWRWAFKTSRQSHKCLISRRFTRQCVQVCLIDRNQSPFHNLAASVDTQMRSFEPMASDGIALFWFWHLCDKWPSPSPSDRIKNKNKNKNKSKDGIV